MSHDFLIFSLKFHQLVLVELFSFLPSRACFGFEYLEEPLPSKIVLFVDELVLVETPYFRVERPATPIFEHKFVAEAH